MWLFCFPFIFSPAHAEAWTVSFRLPSCCFLSGVGSHLEGGVDLANCLICVFFLQWHRKLPRPPASSPLPPQNAGCSHLDSVCSSHLVGSLHVVLFNLYPWQLSPRHGPQIGLRQNSYWRILTLTDLCVCVLFMHSPSMCLLTLLCRLFISIKRGKGNITLFAGLSFDCSNYLCVFNSALVSLTDKLPSSSSKET